MKLAFINDSVYKYASGAPSAVGGAERQQWLLARALVKAGWSVSVAVSEELKFGTQAIIEGVKFVGIGYGYGHVLSAWYRFFIAEHPDWWYWRGADCILGPAVEIAKFAHVNTIFSVAFDSDVYPQSALSRRSYLWPLYAWGLFRCDKIFLQHDKQLSEISSRYRSKVNIVPSIAGPVQAAKSHGQRSDYVAWIGTLRQPKRPDLLVQIAQNAPEIHFIVCGAPNVHRSPIGFGEGVVKDLQRLPNVDFMGQVPPEKAHEIIANAAVLLSTSDGEGFPNTFLQAWSSGTPVVSLTIDPDRVIERLKLGTVSGNADNAISHIRALVGTPEWREEIAVRARKYVEKAHSDALVVAAFESAVGKSPVFVGDCPASVCQSSSPAP